MWLAWGEERAYKDLVSGETSSKGYAEDLEVNGWIILKWIINM
jgi:hypothetical protein